jgi:hypothetical protein
VFLRETDYTYAMAAANNIYTWTAPGLPTYDFKLYICGLYAEVEVEG